ncbi:MAG TPA: hypothetical protein VE733_11835, partial [Streptosporangiaceae bacterium]|nr:hypothetical protein [Streptosporangiaceae bacterium]
RIGLPVHVTTLPGGHDPASWLAGCGPTGLAAWDISSLPGTGPRPVPGQAWARSHAAAAGQHHPGPFTPARLGRADVGGNHPAAGMGTVPGGDLAAEAPPTVSI